MDDSPGRRLQLEAYLGGAPDLPWSFDGWEARAREKLAPERFDYIYGSAGAERTYRANLAAFDRVRLIPRMLGENPTRDLAIEVLGARSPAPFLLAPIGVQSVAHSEAELATARAARATGIPFLLSTVSQFSIEAVAEAAGDHPRWFQLYWINDDEVAQSFVARAEKAGYSAIVVTLDTLTIGWRPRDLEHGWLPFLHGEGIANFTSDPVMRAKHGDAMDDPKQAGPLSVLTFTNLGLGWNDLRRVREWTGLPLLVKGVLSAEDARRALDAGVDGVVVSNHGGRQVDGAVASLDAFPAVRAAVGGRVRLLVDSGIRSGADVLKAMALGADAVLLGRPYIYGLAVAGEEGVRRVIDLFLADIDTTLALIGARSVHDLDAGWLQTTPS